MIAEERHEIIERVTREQGSVSINQLVEMFNVSKMTLWRDISKLDAAGRLVKVHGGAKSIPEIGREPGFYSKSFINGEIKSRIARAAVEMVKEGDVVILEGGTTVMHMVQFIGAEQVSILTNGLNTLIEAAKSELGLEIMVCGGILRKPSLTFVGPEAQKFFEGFSADILFLSGTGLSLDRGVTDPNPLEIEVKRAMIGCARKTVLLMDASKMNLNSLKTAVGIEEIDILVTNRGAPEEMLTDLRARGIEVTVVE